MKYYLIDYENVGPDGLNGVNALDENNSVCIFYSKNADKITFDIHLQLNDSKASIKFYKVETRHKNALDFQLASYLGYIIREHENNCEYFVVSKDNGFIALVSFWEKFNATVSLIPTIAYKPSENVMLPAIPAKTPAPTAAHPAPAPAAKPQTQAPVPAKPAATVPAAKSPAPSKPSAPAPAAKAPAKPASPTPKEIREKIDGIVTDRAVLSEIVKIVRSYKTKQGINNALVKRLNDTKKAGEIYQLIKPFIAGKKGS